ncbi:MAG TPA: DPP IV N-terminal domain-containing protein [Blastocatellia bacterium]|nr:DPP IV N-terminal domain-containing protein [Blastocatellia bacterium]
MSKSSKALYEFGLFRLDPANRLLLRDKESVPLKPKVFDTLLVLVEQSGRTLTKQELMEAIWPDTAVEENNLTQNISILRKVLGLSPDGRHYIETIPRHGYRFAQPVIEVLEEESDVVLEQRTRSRIVIEETQQEESSPYQAETDRASRSALEVVPVARKLPLLRRVSVRTRTIAICVAVGLLLVGAGWIIIHKINTPDPDELVRIVELINWPTAPRQATSRNGTFSRDGKMIVFSLKKGPRSGIWIEQVDGGEAIEIMKDEWDNESPLFSPDGEQIAFVSNRGDQPGIWVVPTFGGTPTLLKLLENGWPELCYWSKDGSAIYYELSANLFALDLNSKQTRQLTAFDPLKSFALHFSVSPEEDRIAYSDGKEGQQDIWVMPIGGGKPRQVTNDPAEDRRPVWHPDGKSIIYRSNNAGTYYICVAYLDGRNPTRVTVDDEDKTVSDISPDGGKILYVAAEERSDIFRLNIDKGEETKFTSDRGLELWPDVSPDGNTVVYQEAANKLRMFNSSILTNSREPEGPHLRLAVDAFDAKWSPDGSKLAFLRRSDDRFDIWTVRATGGNEKKITTGGVDFFGFSGLPYNRMQTMDFSWSPDSSKIAYCSTKSGQANVWVISADGSGDAMISDNTDSSLTVCCPLWSADGKRIAFTSTRISASVDGKALRSVQVAEQGQSRIVFQAYSILRLIGWSDSGDSLLVGLVESRSNYQSTNSQVKLIEVSAGDGGIREIVNLPPAYHTSLRLSPDGRFIVFASRQGGKDGVYLVSTSDGGIRKVIDNNDPMTYFSGLMWSPDGKEIYYSKQESRSLISVVYNSEGR